MNESRRLNRMVSSETLVPFGMESVRNRECPKPVRRPPIQGKKNEWVDSRMPHEPLRYRGFTTCPLSAPKGGPLDVHVHTGLPYPAKGSRELLPETWMHMDPMWSSLGAVLCMDGIPASPMSRSWYCCAKLCWVGRETMLMGANSLPIGRLCGLCRMHCCVCVVRPC